ncbi:phenylacetic acid degradation bifunctional protein PaaZ, partial [Klebsiella pneumoniae]|nr:phenylacetic acid degradation bifunctional protein PaaZ [Klebsiella pneumoniae]
YALSAQTGATRADSWVDIEGGIGTLFTYASLGGRELPDDTLWPEDELIPLSKEGGFAARHVLTSKSGVAVHINAFNFP